MAFEATKKEWCELYSFFRLLADGKVVLGTAEAKAGDTFWRFEIINGKNMMEHVNIILKKIRFV